MKNESRRTWFDHLIVETKTLTDLARKRAGTDQPPSTITKGSEGAQKLTNNGSPTYTVASSTPPPENAILRLPYEIRLAIFKELPDQSSINALAAAHPGFAIVRRESEKSIRKAMRYNFAASIAKNATRHGSLHLTCLALMVQAMTDGRGWAGASHILSNAWVVSGSDLHLLTTNIEDYLRDRCKAAGELEFLGCMTYPVPHLHRWYRRRFCPVTRHVYARSAPAGQITYGTPAKQEDIEVLLVAELWCLCTANYSDVAPSREEFLGLFTPRLAKRAEQFALCYMRSRDCGKIWSRFSSRNDGVVFPRHISAMRTLAGDAVKKIRVRGEERRQISRNLP
ncbi:hypothetical protein HD806DRAFT_12689 [Xylariaceae sp. AK1471]|nr:hypothetical protein HD806DRAFT_12689 [Xylariaceae sp. AK1471]